MNSWELANQSKGPSLLVELVLIPMADTSNRKVEGLSSTERRPDDRVYKGSDPPHCPDRGDVVSPLAKVNERDTWRIRIDAYNTIARVEPLTHSTGM